MIELDLADLVVIAGRVLGADSRATLDQLDVPAAQAALTQARLSRDQPGSARADQASAATAGIDLVHALLRHRPFPRHGEQVAVAAGLQFLSLNGWQADLDPPATAAVVVEALAAGQLSPHNAAAWLSPRLSHSLVTRPRRAHPAARARVPRGRLLVSTGIAIAAGALALLTTACSHGQNPPPARPAVVQQSAAPGAPPLIRWIAPPR
jgi:hypothetical protein